MRSKARWGRRAGQACAAACLLAVVPGGLAETPMPATPAVSAQAYILLDSDSNQVLAELRADQRTPPASLVKLMVSYILSNQLRSGHVLGDDIARVSRNAWAQNPLLKGSSVMFLEIGSRVSVDALLQGLIVASGNDASIAIAEHLAGSESAFVDLMNKQAQELGMADTYFANVHGLSSTEHYTTARDMGTLARAIIRHFPERYPVYRQQRFTWNGIEQRNRNGLLGVSKDVDGLKSGYTGQAGYCLVSSARRDGMRLISVVMKARSERARDRDSRRLLSYGFRFYRTFRLHATGTVLSTPRIWGGAQTTMPVGLVEPLYVTVPKGREGQIEQSVHIDPYLEAPIAKGDVVAELEVALDDRSLVRRELFSLEDIARGNLVSRASDALFQMFVRLWE